MKKIEAIIKPFKLDDVAAVAKAGYQRCISSPYTQKDRMLKVMDLIA